MIRCLLHNKIDKKKWDDCIDHCVNNRIYAYSWYLDIICPNWNALVEDDTRNESGIGYQSVMPLTAGKKYGINYLYPPYFAQQLGVFSIKNLSRAKVHEFLKAIPSYYKFIEINLNIQNTFELHTFQTKRNINIELPLDSPYTLLYKKFSDVAKRNIKNASKHKITILKSASPSELINIFRKNTGKKIHNLKEKNYSTLLRLINTCVQKGYAEVWGAFTQEKKLCAGVIWLVKDTRTVFLFSATDLQAKKIGAMYFLIDTFIRENAGKNIILDFEGSNLHGLARFYKGFGSNEYVYLQARKNNLPKFIRWIKA